MISLIEAIKKINPNAECTVPENIDNIIWHNNTTPISKENILAKQTELQTAYDNLNYARNRKKEYPSIEECIHAILDDDLVALQEKRNAVKLKYPKENS